MGKYVFGRPALYQTPEELQAAIIDYFENGIAMRKVLVGPANNRQMVEIPVPTITGLVLHCGFADRSSFYDYEDKDDFFYTIKKARTFIEQTYEELLQSGGGSAAIFALKNFGWHDKQEIEHSGEVAGTRQRIKDFLDEPSPDDQHLSDNGEASDGDDSEEA